MGIKELDYVQSKEKAAELANLISNHMIENKMTIKQLETSCEIVRDVYKNNAIILQRLDVSKWEN